MHLFPTCIPLLVLLFSSLVGAVNLTQCLEDFRNDPSAVGGVDSRGYPASSVEAVGFTYKTCTARCGSGPESFTWNEFARSLSSWLLPWLALAGRLPSGSGSYTDVIASVVMSVGSPALAAYSLVLTALNGRSVYQRARRARNESRTAVARALIPLQQIPLELTKDDHLLAFIQINHQWRREIVERLNRRSPWSPATGLYVTLVLTPFAFTLIDSFLSLSSPGGASEGYAAGTLWLWLLCLVIGWFWVPTFTSGELKSALRYANQSTTKRAKKAAEKIKRQANKAYNSAAANTTRQIQISKGPWPKKRVVVDPVLEVEKENEKVEVESIQENAEEAAGQGIEPGVGANPATNRSSDSVALSTGPSIGQSSIHPEPDVPLIYKDDFGPLNRDELRFAATFNYSRVMGYLTLADDVFGALDRPIREKEAPFDEVTSRPARDIVFPPGALSSMLNASILALVLQCGTTAAAVIIIVFTPTVGLGCRSLGYIIYGATAVFIMFLTITSTILARVSETRSDKSTVVKGFTASIAIALRRISLLLAFFNATGLVILSCLHFSDLLNNCYCNASVIGRGVDSYIIFSYEGWTQTMRNSRIVATILAAVSMGIYMVFLWIASALPAEIDDL